MHKSIAKLWVFPIFILMTVIFLASCQTSETVSTAQNKTNTSHEHTSTKLPNGDIQEVTKGKQELPSFLLKAEPHIVKAYQAAADHTEVLEKIPCYCGCSLSAGHKNNKNCFIKEVQTDGSIVWDSHGVTCGVCQTIALESAQLKQVGKSDLEIRNYIDSKYSKGFAEPTPTPMPTR